MTFAMVETSPDGIARLRLTGAEWSVLMQYLAATSSETNQATIRVSDVARNLGVTPSAVSQIVSRLRDRRILFRESSLHWHVNTHIAYRGSAEDWGQAYYSDPEPVWEVKA